MALIPKKRGERVKVEPGTELVALFPAYYNGLRIRRGMKFLFQGTELPRWAAIPGTDEAKKGLEEPLADTRPIAVQKAVQRKARQMAAGVRD